MVTADIKMLLVSPDTLFPLLPSLPAPQLRNLEATADLGLRHFLLGWEQERGPESEPTHPTGRHPGPWSTPTRVEIHLRSPSAVSPHLCHQLPPAQADVGGCRPDDPDLLSKVESSGMSRGIGGGTSSDSTMRLKRGGSSLGSVLDCAPCN